MASLTVADVVKGLRDQYSGGVIYSEKNVDCHATETIMNNGFIGAQTYVYLSAMDSIVHKSPACIAASHVNMVAKKVINLGMEDQTSQSIPVRVFAPLGLTIMTNHLSIDNFALINEPKHAFLSCSKLTLSKSTEEEPEYFEIVKSWAINDDMVIDVVTKD